MKNRFKKLIAFLIIFMMTFTNTNLGLFSSNKVFAEENNQGIVTVNDAISVMVDYFNKDYYNQNGGNLEGEQYAAMVRAGADLTKKDWTLNEKIPKTGGYDSISTLGGKASQCLVLLDLGKDPSSFNGRNLIKEIVEELDKTTSSRFIINEIKAMIVVDKFNDRYNDKKVNYNVENLIKLVIQTQKKNGCIDGAVGNTAYAIDLFSKHEGIEGVKEAKKKSLDYLKNTIKEDGTIYEKFYFTKIQGEIVRKLVNAGEDLKADIWSKNGKSIIDGIFKGWNGEIFEKRSGGEENYTVYTEIISALAQLKSAGYGEYILKGVKFNNLIKDEKPKQDPKETSNKIRVRVEGNKDTIYDKNIVLKDEVYAKDLLKGSIGESNVKGLDGGFITEILGEKNTSVSAWMYYLTDEQGNVKEGDMANIQKIKDDTGNYYKEMVWYMAKWAGGTTYIPKVKIEHSGSNYKLNIKEQNIMMGVNPRTAKEVNVKVEGVGEYKTDENGEVSFKVTKGEHKVYVYKDVKDSDGVEYQSIVRQSFTIFGEESQTENKIEEIINQLKKYYSGKELNYLNVLSFNHLRKAEKSQFKLEEPNNAAACADDIMGIIAIGKNPYQYQGMDYVKKLVKAQKGNGKFVIGKNDEDSVTTLLESIMALDMASAKYDGESAVKALLGAGKEGKFEDIDSTTKALISLSKHQDIEGVKELTQSCLKDLKGKQLEGGGFDYGELGNSPYSTGPVIQALISLGEDPTSPKWSKGGKTIFDALCACKVKEKGFQLAEGIGETEDDLMATNLAFAALTDMYKQQSMYHSFRFKVEEPKDYNKIINNEIEDIKNFFSDKKDYDFNATLGLKVAGVKNEEINKNAVIKNKESILFYAQDIMSIVAMGKNPKDYSGKNYVKLLMESINNPQNIKISLKDYVYSLLALDMVSAEQKDVQIIISNIEEQFKKGGVRKVSDIALVTTALSPYKDKPEIKSIIDSCLNSLKGEQLDNGAFTLKKSKWPKGDSEDTALVIEAIIAAGQDPLSKEWCKGDKTPIDALLSFKMGNGYIYESSLGAYEQQMYTGEVLRAFVAVKEKSTVFSKLKMNHEQIKDKTTLAKESLKELRDYYSSKEKFDSIEALSFNFSSDDISQDIKIIQEKYKAIEKCKYVNDYSENIIGVTASGKDPRKYNSMDYVETLLKAQVKEGKDKGKFVIQEGEGNWTTMQAWVILALDMAQANYDREEAVKALCKMSSNGVYKDVYTTAMAITALAPYKDSPEVKKILDASIKYFKEKQNPQGGYDLNIKGKNDTRTIAKVIQALIANGIDPLSDEWSKDGSTMLDALLKNKKDGKFGSDILNCEAFMALADLYKGSSMFKIHSNLPISGKGIQIKNITNAKEFKLGSEAKITVQATNNFKENKKAILVVALFDGNKKMINYVAAKQVIRVGDSVELQGMMKLPEKRKCTVRAFVWDSMEGMNPLSEVIEIPVK